MVWSVCVPLILTGVIGFVVVKLFFRVGMYVTYFSRLAIGALLAALISLRGPQLVENGWANFGIWAAIVLGAGSALCLLPRIRCTLSFLCNVLIVELFVALLVYFLLPAFFPIFQPTPLVGTLTQVVCFGYALWLLILQVGETELHDHDNLMVRVFDRLLASTINALAVNVIGMIFFPLFYTSVFVLIACQVGLMAAFFVGDLLLFTRLFPVDVPDSAAAARFERVRTNWHEAEQRRAEERKIEAKYREKEEQEEYWKRREELDRWKEEEKRRQDLLREDYDY